MITDCVHFRLLRLGTHQSEITNRGEPSILAPSFSRFTFSLRLLSGSCLSTDALLRASFRPSLASTPLRFASPSPRSAWIRNSHHQTANYVRHTKQVLRLRRRMTLKKAKDGGSDFKEDAFTPKEQVGNETDGDKCERKSK
jgi:hypothetical protein